MKKLPLLASLALVSTCWALVGSGATASAAPTNVYAAAPTFVPGAESSMAFTPTTDPTLLAQLDNQQGSDADSTIYSQAFQVTADGTVDTISWWGTGAGQAGFMVALQDGVWGSSTLLPNGPVVEGVLAQLSVVPIAQVTRTPATNGETMFQIELLYGGLFQITGVSEADMEPVLMVECPRYLFPYARRVISDLTSEGGFPPFMLDPIDFGAVYMARKAQMEANGGGAA